MGAEEVYDIAAVFVQICQQLCLPVVAIAVGGFGGDGAEHVQLHHVLIGQNPGKFLAQLFSRDNDIGSLEPGEIKGLAGGGADDEMLQPS